MCRLLGVIANRSVDFHFSLKRFKENFAKKNPDGWGIGWYDEDGSARVFKEGNPIGQDNREFYELMDTVCSKILIAHVRKASCGERSRENSHPFQHENWIFAHNGSVDRDLLWQKLDEAYKRKVQGQTDSEVYFYWILQCINEQHGNIVEGMRRAVFERVFDGKAIIDMEKTTGLNFVMSDGTKLYAFRYARGNLERYGLYLLERDPKEYGPTALYSKETGQLIESKSLAGEKAVLICSEELGDGENSKWHGTNIKKEPWKPIKPRNLVIVNESLEVQTTLLL